MRHLRARKISAMSCSQSAARSLLVDAAQLQLIRFCIGIWNTMSPPPLSVQWVYIIPLVIVSSMLGQCRPEYRALGQHEFLLQSHDRDYD
jgi:hypothetical protein